MQLTIDQKHALERGEPVAVSFDDTECVILRRDVYEQSRATAEEDEWLSSETLYGLVESVMAEDDAHDPALESYQHYKSQP